MIEYKNEEREDSGYLFICTCTLKGGVYDNQKMYLLSYMFHYYWYIHRIGYSCH